MSRLPVYEVVYLSGDELYPESWAVVYTYKSGKEVRETFSLKKNAVPRARKAAKKLSRSEGLAKLLVRTKDGDVTEETTYQEGEVLK